LIPGPADGVGDVVTATDAEALALPPAPLQVNVKLLFAVNAPVDWLPEVALVPDQPPEAEQEVALVEDQVSVEAAPLTTDVGFAVNDTVGGGFVPVVTVYVMVVVVVTPFASVEFILTVCWPGAPGTCGHGFQSPHITYGYPPSALTNAPSNVKVTPRQFCSVVSLMKVKFLDGSVAVLITTPFVIFITSAPC
jgi:hypothetical protein